MQPLVSHDEVARTALQAILYTWLACELMLQIRTRVLGGRGTSDWTVYLVLGSITTAIAGGSELAQVQGGQFGGGIGLVSVGLGLLAAGAAFRLSAMAKLGRLFTFRVSIQAGHHVVRCGPYRLVRHPSYTGLLVVCLGLGVALESWLSLLTLILLPVLAILLRISVEERTLVAALGAEYGDYAASTPRLIPHLW